MLSNEIERKFIESYDISDYEMWTDNGWEDVTEAHLTTEYQVYILTLSDGTVLKCADTHIVFDEYMNEVFVKDLCVGDTIITEHGNIPVQSVIVLDEYENMYDFSVNSTEHRYYTNGILSHNTTTCVSYMLWLTLFHNDKKIAVLANKAELARDILANYKSSYEDLPKWLQQGVRVWNKGRIILENGSSITAAATTSNAIRGSSFNCITGETKVVVCDDYGNIWNDEIQNILSSKNIDYHNSKFAVYKITNKVNNKNYIGFHETDELDDCYIGCGDLIKLDIETYGIENFTKEILFASDKEEDALEKEYELMKQYPRYIRMVNDNISVKPEILTSNGFKHFDGIKVSLNKEEKILLKFSNDTVLRCTKDHRLLVDEKWKYAKDILIGDFCESFNSKLEVIDKHSLISEENVYDPINVDGGNHYLSNGITSHNCVILDEFAFVSNNIADEFMASVLPTISSSEEAQIIIISTPRGMNHYYKIWNDAKNKTNSYIPFEAHWSEVPGRDENWAREQLQLLGQVKYEQEVECRFLGSTNTLIDGRTLQNMKYKAPVEKKKIFNNQYIEIFEHPKPGGDGTLDVETGRIYRDANYVACVDVAEGLGLDYSVITIIDVTTLPYKVVAKYRSNTIQPIVFPAVIVEVCKYYNNAWCLIEINQQPQVAETVYKDFHYDKMIKVTNTGNGLNQYMTLDIDKRTRYGIKTSHTTKRMGCNALKDLIESGKLIHYDFELYQEFTTFIRINNSFGADDGYHDDIVMSLVLFGWMTTQEKFKDITNHDLRKQFQKDELSYIETEKKEIPNPNNQIPPSFVEKAFVADNTLWLLDTGDAGYNSQYSDFLGEFVF